MKKHGSDETPNGAAPMKLVHTTPLPSSSVLTTSKAAKYLSMSRCTILHYTDLGKVRCFDLFGRRVYKLEDLDLLVNSLPAWGNQGDRYERKMKAVRGDSG